MATETREDQWITDLLEPYAGAIMGDACASHNQLLARSNILALFCWAHALNWKNSLFHASAAGARSYAIMQTLIQSAVKLGFNPEAYLNGIVQAFDGKSVRR